MYRKPALPLGIDNKEDRGPHDFAAGPPSRYFDDPRIGRRPAARYTFRPLIAAGLDDGTRTQGIWVDVVTSFRIELRFQFDFRLLPSGVWECTETETSHAWSMKSVQAVVSQMRERAAELIAEHLENLEPLFQAAREVDAARALAASDQATRKLDEARREYRRRRDDFAACEVSPQRARQVMEQCGVRL